MSFSTAIGESEAISQAISLALTDEKIVLYINKHMFAVICLKKYKKRLVLYFVLIHVALVF